MSEKTDTGANPPDSSIYIPSHMPESAGKFPAASFFQDVVLPEDEKAPPPHDGRGRSDMKRVGVMALLSVVIFGLLFVFLSTDPQSEDNFLDSIMSDINSLLGNDDSFSGDDYFETSPQELGGATPPQNAAPPGDAGFFDAPQAAPADVPQGSAPDTPAANNTPEPGSLADVLGETPVLEENDTPTSPPEQESETLALPEQGGSSGFSAEESATAGSPTPSLGESLGGDLPTPGEASLTLEETQGLDINNGALTLPKADPQAGEAEAENNELELYQAVPSELYVLDVLERINIWLAEGQHDETELRSFLLHRKAWARLGALGYAVEKQAISKEEIEEAAMLLKRDFNRGRIRRFLRRYKFDKPVVYQEMRRLLWR